MRAQRLIAATVVIVLTVVGCSGDEDDGAGTDQGGQDAADQLAAAADQLDSTSGVRFTVEGSDLPDSGTVILGAEGVAAPPRSFDGDIRVLTAGLSATIEVVSVDGELWAKLPMTTEFALVDAEALGFSDPGALLDPERGVSQLLRSAIDPAESGQVRIGSAVADEITATLPGELVGSVLAIADPDAEVAAAFALDADDGHLRRAVLTGPFVEDSGAQTYTVLLEDYDQAVDISAPTD
ncbi:MAG TPA: LppX_LprAFG lipoprotein [Jiangellaceae bacterium]|nr:LppX_LprAFG lipoprotein [Jiangellaceae bacterium]